MNVHCEVVVRHKVLQSLFEDFSFAGLQIDHIDCEAYVTFLPFETINILLGGNYFAVVRSRIPLQQPPSRDISDTRS